MFIEFVIFMKCGKILSHYLQIFFLSLHLSHSFRDFIYTHIKFLELVPEITNAVLFSFFFFPIIFFSVCSILDSFCCYVTTFTNLFCIWAMSNLLLISPHEFKSQISQSSISRVLIWIFFCLPCFYLIF